MSKKNSYPQISIRVSQEEKDLIVERAKASGIKLSEYTRTHLLSESEGYYKNEYNCLTIVRQNLEEEVKSLQKKLKKFEDFRQNDDNSRQFHDNSTQNEDNFRQYLEHQIEKLEAEKKEYWSKINEKDVELAKRADALEELTKKVADFQQNEQVLRGMIADVQKDRTDLLPAQTDPKKSFFSRLFGK